MAIFTAALGSFSFLSVSESQPFSHSPSSLFSFPLSKSKHAHNFTAKMPFSVSSNTPILQTGILHYPSSPHSIPHSQVIEADEGKWNLVFSEKEAAWSRYSGQVKVGGIFEGRVSSVEDYGAFVHLRFPDGLYHLTGLVHISEVSWDLVGDVRDILAECDEVRVKVISVDRGKSRISLSIRQLEEDPLLENLDIVLPQDGLAYPSSLGGGDSSRILPLPGLERILGELLQEDGIDDARIRRQWCEKGVISQDLQLWLSNAPPTNQRFNLLALAGRQMQEIHLTTSLDQEGIKRALQRVLQRIP